MNATSVSSPAVRTPLLWISASAGTGKTFCLSTRYLELLFAGVPVDTIVATTFTRKAAGEILERVLSRLADAIEHDSKRKELAASIGRRALKREECQRVLSGVLRQLHRLRIGTIDSLFAQVARCYSLELELPIGWTVCEEHELENQRRAAIQAVLDENDAKSLGSMINLMAKGDSVRSVYRLMDQAVVVGYAAYRDSVEGAWEHPRIPARPSESPEALRESLKLLAKQFPEFQKAIDNDLERWGEVPWDSLLGAGIYKKVLEGGTTFRRKELPSEIVSCYQKLIAHAGRELVQLVAWQTEGTRDLLEAYDLQVRKLRGGGLSFDDVTWFVARHIGADHNAASDYAFRMDSRMDHWLLDEFQDTSALQWRVLKAMVQAAPLAGGGSFFCVGDAKQAIYGWRGGSASIFRSIPHDESFPPIKKDTLTSSWRSAPAVIDTVNRIFQQGKGHNRLENYPAVPQWLEQFPTHTTQRSSWPGYATLRVADDKDSVMEAAVAEIAYLRREAPDRSIGVLVRKNETVAELRHMMMEAGIAASEEGGNPLTDSPAVAWVRAWLKLLDHPQDSVARFQWLHSPLGKHGRSSPLEELHNDELFAATAKEGKSRLMERGLGATLEEVVRGLGPSVGARDARRLEQLVELAYQFEPQAGTRTAPFLRLLETRRVADPGDQPVRVMTIHQAKGLEFDCVVLPELEVDWYRNTDSLVIHRPTPGDPIDRAFRRPNKTVLPFLQAEERQDCEDAGGEAIGELLCLLYVALTRPRYGLYMFVAPQDKAEHQLGWSGLLRAALADGEPLMPGETAYETGDARWWRQLPTETASTRTVAPEPPRRFLLTPAPRRKKLPPRVAPSQVDDSTRRRAAELLSLNTAPMEYGTLVHAWFESIEWLEGEPAADPARLAEIAARTVRPADSGQLDSWIRQFLEYLQSPHVSRFLRRRSYDDPVQFGVAPAAASQVVEWTVSNERPIHWQREDGALVVGSIDRLVVGRDADGRVVAAHIIDYKTGKVENPAQLEERRSHYQPQMDAYAAVVAEIYGIEPSSVVTDLVFVDADAGLIS